MQGRLLTLIVLGLILAPAALPLSAGTTWGHRPWSTVPAGPYGWSPTGVAYNFTASDGTHISYGVFMPTNVPPGTRVPIILTAGPYFDLLEESVTELSSDRMSGFLVTNFVSHGYAVVSASTRGSGWSGGCMELMSLREAQDLNELVTFLAGQSWSNGNIGMIGKSYDGGTPWMVAQFGNPNLKTIVPMQGVSDMADLLVNHGAPQFRTPVFHPAVYWPFGLGLGGTSVGYYNPGRSVEDRAANVVCPEMVKGAIAGVWSTYTGDTTTAPGVAEYWNERDFASRALTNYTGSVFIVHGLQDFNVVPSQVVPLFNDLTVEKKMLLGQWAHAYPDDGTKAANARATPVSDFATTLKTWFDHSLKGMNVDTGPVVQVADASYEATSIWRATSQWPMPPTSTRMWALSAGDALTTGPAMPFATPIVTPGGAYLTTTGSQCDAWAPAGTAEFISTPIASKFRFSGLGGVDVRLEPATQGVIAATLCEGYTVIAHGATNTLYADGSKTPRPFVPGLPLDVTIEFEPAEYTVAAGATLRLLITVEDYVGGRGGGDYFPGTSPGVAVVTGGTLSLPVN